MAHVTVTVNNASYTLACDDGQEAHVTALAKQFDKRVAEVKREARNASDAQLLVMAGLLLEDELDAASQGDEDKFALLLENAARRMEDIAARLA
ncbi:MAG: cell division protein ZapA [Micropepsaceae bacterium]